MVLFFFKYNHIIDNGHFAWFLRIKNLTFIIPSFKCLCNTGICSGYEHLCFVTCDSHCLSAKLYNDQHWTEIDVYEYWIWLRQMSRH